MEIKFTFGLINLTADCGSRFFVKYLRKSFVVFNFIEEGRLGFHKSYKVRIRLENNNFKCESTTLSQENIDNLIMYFFGKKESEALRNGKII